MPLAAIVVGIALAVAILALTPVGRRLVATTLDMVDGSVAMYAIRRALDLDTTTARQRRIDRRHAREQAEILRRIGGHDHAPGERPIPAPAAPNRLVVSGGAAATPETAPAVAMTPASDRRRTLLRDGLVGAVGLAMVLVAVSAVVNQPTGAVLGATATPGERGGDTAPSAVSATAGRSVPAAIASPITADPTPTAVASPSSGTTAAAGPTVAALIARLAGPTGGGATVPVRLSWELAPGSPSAARFVVSVQVGDRPARQVAAVDGAMRTLAVTIGLGRPSTFRIQAIGAGDVAATAEAWAPITASRTQEDSRSVTRKGAWRSATGPSLSGGGVTFSATRGTSLSFPFTGTDVAWIGTKTPMSGRAQVRMDGRLVDTVDLAADAVRYRQVIARRHLATGGRHVLEIRPLGDGRVDVDAFVVLR